MSSLRTALLVGLLCMPAGAAHGQGRGGDDDTVFLARPDAVVLHNAGGQTIDFAFGPDGAALRDQRLGAGEARQFSEGRSPSYVIELVTAGQAPVRYALGGSRRYQIYWNAARGVWDVTELLAQR